MQQNQIGNRMLEGIAETTRPAGPDRRAQRRTPPAVSDFSQNRILAAPADGAARFASGFFRALGGLTKASG
jgi:hypothetical protein